MRTSLESKPVKVQFLHVPGCTLVDRVRETLRRSLARSGLRAVLEDLEGEYASPTLLINGIDVIGRRPATQTSSCRLDLPTEEQVLAALERPTGLDCDRDDSRRLGPDARTAAH